MIRIPFVRMAYACNKRVMSELPGFSNGSMLRLVIGICDTSPMRVFQYVVSDGASFRTTFRLRLDVDVSHAQSPKSFWVRPRTGAAQRTPTPCSNNRGCR